MFRVRYYSAGRKVRLPTLPPSHPLTVTWLAVSGDVFLFADTDKKEGRTLLLAELQRLPLARIELVPNDGVDVSRRFANELSFTPASTPPPDPDAPTRLALSVSGSVVIRWKGKALQSATVYSNQDRAGIGEAVQEAFPNASVKRRMFGRQRPVLPPSSFSLPDAEQYPSVASRNNRVVPFSTRHDDGIPFAVADQPRGELHLPLRPRCLWVGYTRLVPRAIGGIVAQWPGPVVAVDRTGWLEKGRWNTRVLWGAPARGQRINPLGDGSASADVDKVELAMEWLEALGINRVLLSRNPHDALRVLVRAWVETGASINPYSVLYLLGSPNIVDLGGLSEQDTALIAACGGITAMQAHLSVAEAIVRGLLSTPQASYTWRPPFDPVNGPRVLVSVPDPSKDAEMFAASYWPLLRRLITGETLVVGVAPGQMGKRMTNDAINAGASLLLWGMTLDEVGGSDVAEACREIVVSRTPDVRFASKATELPSPVILSQADDQVIVRIDDDVGTATLPAEQEDDGLPRPAVVRRTMETVRLSDVPQPVAVLASEDQARTMLSALIGRGGTLVVSGNGKAPPLPRRAVIFDWETLPTINPLVPRSLKRWLWWGRAAGLPDEALRIAWRKGARTLQDVLSAVLETEYEQAVLQVVRSGLWGEGNLDLHSLLRSQTVGLSVTDPAVVRCFVAAAVDTGARLVAWKADDLLRLPPTVLHRTRAVLCVTRWPDDLALPVLFPGGDDTPDLPDEVRSVAAKHDGQWLLYRDGRVFAVDTTDGDGERGAVMSQGGGDK